MFQNYHKHTSLSNIYTKDSPLIPEDYWIELKNRYGNEVCVYTTVEHGWQSNYFKIYDDLEKFNKKNRTNIKFVFGTEAYWVKDRISKDNSNCHIVILARNDNGRKAINKMLSIANKDGYYYKPRIDLELLMQLPPNDVFITTACIAFWNKYEDIDKIVMQLNQHFKYFYLEVQCHNTDKQKQLNAHIIDLSNKYHIPLIAGCDSHVITESQLADRDDLLKSAHIEYEDEDGWYMGYPTEEVLIQRFKEQGILTKEQIQTAIQNTNDILKFEDIILDRSLKVPVINEYKSYTQEQRNKVFEKLLVDEWNKQKWDINTNKYDEYITEVKHDIQEIESCNMADYFILSYYVMKYGQEKHNGVLTPSGRGSAVSMYINKLLNLTKVDRINSPVLMYPERFLTKERVLDSHTPPDIDNNVSEREPFIQAQRELLGDLGTYDLLALGTLKIKAAWKMYARAYNIDPQVANEVSKQINKYENAEKYKDENETINIKDYVEPQYYDLIDGCQRYLGIYDNRKGHPCATVAYNGDVESDIGIMLCKSETTGKEVLAAVIESGTIDSFGYLKQDYLVVNSIGLTYDIYKEVGIEPLTVNQLLDKIKDNQKVWDIYAKGYTMCVNQVEQPKATEKIMRYKPKNISELTQFVAAIRPSFQSMYKTFENREHFEYGIKALDNLLQDEYCSSSFILYQESLMKVLGFAGFPMSETYTIIKAISKKKDYIIKDAKPKFITNFAQAILDTKETNDESKAHELATQVWTIVENSAAYSFNSAHAYCMAIDSVTIAYLKAYYPLEFYKIVLQRFTNKGEKDRVSLLKQEMLARGIKLKPIQFGDDNRQFNIDRENNQIIQTMASIKSMPKSVPNALYEMRDENITKRSQLYLALLSNKDINNTAIDILIKLDYFSKYGNPNMLMYELSVFRKYYDAKVLSKDKLSDLEIQCAKKVCKKETDKQFRDFDSIDLISTILSSTATPSTTIQDHIKYQIELLGYTTLSDPKCDTNIFVVQNVETNNFGNTFVNLYSITYGVAKKFRVNKKFKSKEKLKIGDCIKCAFWTRDKFKQSEDGHLVKTGETFTEIKCWGKNN